MGGLSRQHDRELLDALESHRSEAVSGETWRITAKGRDALRGSTAGGRWSPPGEFEVLYTSLARGGALAEIGYRLSLEPVWPNRLEHELHRITARTSKSLRFTDVSSLSILGVDVRRYATFEYSVTQAIAAAAFFLDFDGLIVPSARCAELIADLVSTISLKRSTQNLQRSKRRPADYPIFWFGCHFDGEDGAYPAF